MSMPGSETPRIQKLPFWMADLVLLGAATVLVAYGQRPLSVWQMAAVTVCAGLGGWLAVLPFLRDHEAAVHLSETRRLAETTAKLDQLEVLAERISQATAAWQGVQERSQQTAVLASEVVERLTSEAEQFATAVSRAADGDKQTLKLEVEKLRKADVEWVQSVGRLMDHVFALHVAALRSGQPTLVDQIERFHAACRDALRRVGFVSIVAAPDEPFDPRKHHPADGARPGEGARVNETVGPGYVYQGKLIRPIAVTVLAAGEEAPEDTEGGGSLARTSEGATSSTSAPPGPGGTSISHDAPADPEPTGIS